MIAGTVVIMKVKPSKSTRIGLLIAFYTIFTLNAVAVLLYGLLIRNVGGRTKQATAIVMVLCVSCPFLTVPDPADDSTSLISGLASLPHTSLG